MDGLFDCRKYSLAVYDSYSDDMIRKSKHSLSKHRAVFFDLSPVFSFVRHTPE